VEARVIALNASTGTVITAAWLKRSPGSVGEPSKVESHALQPGSQPDSNLPWFENAGGSSGLRFAPLIISTDLSDDLLTCTCLQKRNFLISLISSSTIVDRFTDGTLLMVGSTRELVLFEINSDRNKRSMCAVSLPYERKPLSPLCNVRSLLTLSVTRR